MKNFFLVLVFVVFGFRGAQAQISLQYTFPAANNYMTVVRFGYAGDKYMSVDYPNDRIQIYSLSQTLEKDISIPAIIADTNYVIYYVSDNLFDLDSSIEYMAYTYATYPYTLFVIKEDGSVLFSRDTVGPITSNNLSFFSKSTNFSPEYPNFTTDMYPCKVFPDEGNVPSKVTCPCAAPTPKTTNTKTKKRFFIERKF